MTSVTSLGISPAVGSSTIMILGSLMSTIPSASIWRSPPLRVPAALGMKSLSTGKRLKTNSILSLIMSASLTVYAAILRFSATLSLLKMLPTWGM